MPFTPSWEPGALLDLADLWTYAPNQAAVTLAADQIDEDLQRDPFDRAEDRGAYRCRKHPPLLVLFEVSVDDCRVRVFHVQRYP
jgi:hypothetical protein